MKMASQLPRSVFPPFSVHQQSLSLVSSSRSLFETHHDVESLPLRVDGGTNQYTSEDGLRVFHACHAATSYWQWRLLALMAEQQAQVIQHLANRQETYTPYRHRRCSIKRDSNRCRCHCCTHRDCCDPSTFRKRRRKVRCLKGVVDEQDSETWSESDIETTATDVSSPRQKKMISTDNKMDNDGKHVNSRELSYWDEITIACELNYEFETQLINHLVLLSTTGFLFNNKIEAQLQVDNLTRDETDRQAQAQGQGTSPTMHPQLSSPNTPPLNDQSSSQTVGVSVEQGNTASANEKAKAPRSTYLRELDLTPTPLPSWDTSLTIFGGTPLLAQLSAEEAEDILAFPPPHHEHVSAPTSSASNSYPRRRIAYQPPPDTEETQVPQHPLERFPFGVYVRVGVILVILGLPTESLMILALIAGFHLSGSLDPFLNWLSSVEARWRNGHWLITNRRPLSQVLAELQARRDLRRETTALVEQAQRILGQLQSGAAQRRPTDTVDISSLPCTLGDLKVDQSKASDVHERTLPDQNSKQNSIETLSASPRESSLETSLSSSSSESVSTTRVIALTRTTARNNGGSVASNYTVSEAPATSSLLDGIQLNNLNFSSLPGEAPKVIIVDAVSVAPATRIEEWLLHRRILRHLMVHIDWWVRWAYQLVVALLLSLNPAWQPLTAFVSEMPLFPALASAQALSFTTVSTFNTTNETGQEISIGSHIVPPSSDTRDSIGAVQCSSSTTDIPQDIRVQRKQEEDFTLERPDILNKNFPASTANERAVPSVISHGNVSIDETADEALIDNEKFGEASYLLKHQTAFSVNSLLDSSGCKVDVTETNNDQSEKK